MIITVSLDRLNLQFDPSMFLALHHCEQNWVVVKCPNKKCGNLSFTLKGFSEGFTFPALSISSSILNSLLSFLNGGPFSCPLVVLAMLKLYCRSFVFALPFDCWLIDFVRKGDHHQTPSSETTTILHSMQVGGRHTLPDEISEAFRHGAGC